MALFLSESIYRTPNVSLEEALIGLSELMHEGAALTEALYQAEFIRYLNESQYDEGDGGDDGGDFAARESARQAALARAARSTPSDTPSDTPSATSPRGDRVRQIDRYKLDGKKDGKSSIDNGMNFLERAWEAIKNFGRKVWQKVKLVFNAIRNKLSVWYNKLMGNKNEVFKVSKGKLENLKAKILNIENLIIIDKRTFKDATEYGEAVDKENERHDKIVEKYKDTEDSNLVQVSKSELKQLQSRANDCMAKSESAGAEKESMSKKIDAKIKALESRSKADGKTDEEKKELESLVSLYKKGSSLLSSLAVKNSSVANYIMAMVIAGGEEALKK